MAPWPQWRAVCLIALYAIWTKKEKDLQRNYKKHSPVGVWVQSWVERIETGVYAGGQWDEGRIAGPIEVVGQSAGIQRVRSDCQSTVCAAARTVYGVVVARLDSAKCWYVISERLLVGQLAGRSICAVAGRRSAAVRVLASAVRRTAVRCFHVHLLHLHVLAVDRIAAIFRATIREPDLLRIVRLINNFDLDERKDRILKQTKLNLNRFASVWATIKVDLNQPIGVYL